MGGLTGTGCISFAPVIQTDCSKNPFNDEGTGSEIDRCDARSGTLDPLWLTIFGGNASLAEQRVWTVGGYHDVTPGSS